MPKRKAPVRSKKARSKLRNKPVAKKSRTLNKRTELKSSGWYDKAAELLAIRRGSS